MLDFPTDRIYLAPSLYQNFSQAGLNTAVIKKLGGIYRYTWTKNQEDGRKYLAALRLLIKSGQTPIHLPGSALALKNGGASGSLPLNPLSLFVRRESAVWVFSVLEDQGWFPHPGVEPKKREAYLQAAGEHLFRNQSSLDIRLHWSLVGDAAFDEQVHQNAEPAGDWGNQPALEHRMLLASLPQRRDPDFFHLVLMSILLRDQAGFEWESLLAEARQYGLELFLKKGLLEISDLCPDKVPQDVVARLIKIEPKTSQGTSFLLIRYRSGYFNKLKSLWLKYRLAGIKDSSQVKIGGFLEFLQNRLQRKGVVSILFYALEKIAGDIRMRLENN